MNDVPLSVFAARWVLPVDRPPIAHGAVAVRGDTLEAVGRASDFSRVTNLGNVIDLGNVLLLPGFVNPHTHLEFSDLSHPLGSEGMPFPEWIRRVIAYRRETPADIPAAVTRGLAESLAQGVTAVGEIAVGEWPDESFARSPIAATIFYEVLGLSPAREAASLENVEKHIQAAAEQNIWRAGISPHAPYSVSWSLFQGAILAAKKHSLPLAFHLAESREELQLLATGSGPFRDLLESLGVWTEGAIPRGVTPMHYLRELADLPRSLIIHGNYLSPQEIAFVGSCAEKMSLIYCPRTHGYFQHRPWPLREMLRAKATVAIGTDGRGSAQDLSILAELRHVARLFPDVSRETILTLGTLNAVKALGLERERGSLTPGKRGDLVVVPLASETTNPAEALLESDVQPSGVMIAGSWKISPW